MCIRRHYGVVAKHSISKHVIPSTWHSTWMNLLLQLILFVSFLCKQWMLNQMLDTSVINLMQYLVSPFYIFIPVHPLWRTSHRRMWRQGTSGFHRLVRRNAKQTWQITRKYNMSVYVYWGTILIVSEYKMAVYRKTKRLAMKRLSFKTCVCCRECHSYGPSYFHVYFIIHTSIVINKPITYVHKIYKHNGFGFVYKI